MTWNNQSITQLIVNEQTEGVSGFFGYSPAVGSGNLSFSVSASAGTDGSGNNYPAGMGLINTPAVWYENNSGAGVAVVQTATLGVSANHFQGTFANPVTAGNTMCMIFQADGNNSPPTIQSGKFNGTSVTFPGSGQLQDGSDNTFISGYLSTVAAGTALTGTLSSSPLAQSTGGIMVEVSGLTGSVNVTCGGQDSTSHSFSSGPAAPPGSPPGVYLAGVLNFGNAITGGREGWTNTGSGGISGYLAGVGQQQYAGTLASSQYWFSGISAFTSGGVQVQGVITSVSPANTVDSVTGSTVPLGVTSQAVSVNPSATTLAGVPFIAGTNCSLFYVLGVSGTGTLYAEGASGVVATIAVT